MRRTRSAEAPGYDSFLDIVANLVGILIILVIVVGARAKEAFMENVIPAAIAGPQEADVLAAAQAARELEDDVNALEASHQHQEAILELRRQEREQFQYAVTALEKKLEQEKQKLDASAQAEFELSRRATELQGELEEIARRRRLVRQQAGPTVLEHVPTPLAKTVFGRELHFRLAGGRIAYVPMDELVEELKRDAPRKIQYLRDQAELVETLGPRDGFWMKYTLRMVEGAVMTPSGPATQRRGQFAGFVLLPVEEDIGEPLDLALQPGSQFRQRIDRADPRDTTVTVWVYPDSYEGFRALRQTLLAQGLLTAGRPMPPGKPIGGAPDGSRSVAQ